jgi:hypothetical protein
MKAKVYFFRLVIGFSAFLTGISVYSFFQASQLGKFPTAAVENATQPNSEIDPTVELVKQAKAEAEVNIRREFAGLFEQVQADTEQSVRQEFEAKYSFVPDGEYYPSEDDLSEGFKNVQWLVIESTDWTNATADIPPRILTKGEFKAGKLYKFVKIAINNRLISFETEQINGIRYAFVGNFPDDTDFDEKHPADLLGILKKYKNGKLVAKQDFGFYVGGC